MTKPKKRLSERQRKRMLDEWANTPALNPFYRGKTPLEVVRMLARRQPARRAAE